MCQAWFGVQLPVQYGCMQVAAKLHNVRVNGSQVSAGIRPAFAHPRRLNGICAASGNSSGVDAFNADLQLAEFGFSDTSGLHAAEKCAGHLSCRPHAKHNLALADRLVWHPASCSGSRCIFAAAVATRYWRSQPIAGAAAKSPSCTNRSAAACRGGYKPQRVRQFRWRAFQCRASRCGFAGNRARANFRIVGCEAESAVGMHGARHRSDAGKIVCPIMPSRFSIGRAGRVCVIGHADIDWQYRNGATQSLRLNLRDAGIADAAQRFALRGVNSEIDWQADAPRTATSLSPEYAARLANRGCSLDGANAWHGVQCGASRSAGFRG